MLENEMWTWRTEILKKPEERGFVVGRIPRARSRITVVIARDGENRGIVILVRLVELHRIIPAYSVEVDDISQVIKEKRLLGRLVICAAVLDLLDHHGGQPILNLSAVDPATVANHVKDHRFGLRDPGIRSRQDNVERNTEVNVVSCRRRDKCRVGRRRRDRIVKRPLGFTEGKRSSHKVGAGGSSALLGVGLFGVVNGQRRRLPASLL